MLLVAIVTYKNKGKTLHSSKVMKYIISGKDSDGYIAKSSPVDNNPIHIRVIDDKSIQMGYSPLIFDIYTKKTISEKELGKIQADLKNIPFAGQPQH